MSGRSGVRRWLSPAGMPSLLLAAIALVGSACQAGTTAELSSRPLSVDRVAGVTTTTPTPDPTTAVPTTVAPTPGEPLPGLGVGAQGPNVLALEQKLTALRYFVGKVDEAYDADTQHAVTAFQKVNGMERTGRATDDVVAAIRSAQGAPAPLVANGGLKRVEIDLDRQVLFLYEGNTLDVILPVSTGNNQRFCSEGWCRRAVTPTGSFAIYDKRSGWERSPLGRLYNSQYFNGGIAIHGSTSIPAWPASHGCVRIQMSAAEWFPDRVSLGTPVYVVAADEPVPAPYVARTTPASTPTTIVPDTNVPPVTTPAVATTTTTTPNLLSGLFGPPPTPAP